MWRTSLVLSLGACVFATASLARSDDVYIFGYIRADGKWLDEAVLVITEQALARAPAWKPIAGDPPLSAREAIRRAAKTKQKFIADFNDQDKWTLSSTALVPSGSGGSERWYWLVTYEIRDHGTGPLPQFRIGVLMDGTIVEPTTELRGPFWPVVR